MINFVLDPTDISNQKKTCSDTIVMEAAERTQWVKGSRKSKLTRILVSEQSSLYSQNWGSGDKAF